MSLSDILNQVDRIVAQKQPEIVARVIQKLSEGQPPEEQDRIKCTNQQIQDLHKSIHRLNQLVVETASSRTDPDENCTSLLISKYSLEIAKKRKLIDHLNKVIRSPRREFNHVSDAEMLALED